MSWKRVDNGEEVDIPAHRKAMLVDNGLEV